MTPQMELSFDNAHRRLPRVRRSRRLRSARWWFSQMRQAVDSALDRHPAQPGRAEQIYLSLDRHPEFN